MLVRSPCVVSLSWILKDAQGELIDELIEPMDFLVGGDDLFTRVEEGLMGHAAGDELDLHLEPEQAFGDYDADLVFFEARNLFPDHLEPGMQFEGPPEGAATPGIPTDAIYTVTEVYDHHVVLDGNHPLAGLALRLLVKIHAVRAATSQEIEDRTAADAGYSLLGIGSAPPQLH